MPGAVGPWEGRPSEAVVDKAAKLKIVVRAGGETVFVAKVVGVLMKILPIFCLFPNLLLTQKLKSLF